MFFSMHLGSQWNLHLRVWGWVLCCLMTLGLRNDIKCHVWPYFFSLLANHQNRHQTTSNWVVNLVIAMGTLIFLRSLCEYVWANILEMDSEHNNHGVAHQCQQQVDVLKKLFYSGFTHFILCGTWTKMHASRSTNYKNFNSFTLSLGICNLKM